MRRGAEGGGGGGAGRDGYDGYAEQAAYGEHGDDYDDDYVEVPYDRGAASTYDAAHDEEYAEVPYERGAVPAFAEEYDEDYDSAYDDAPRRAPVGAGEPDELPNLILTIPNLISLARLAGVPLFLGLILSPHYGGPKYDYWALVVLMLSGFSDWLDGKLARRWNQMSRIGAMLDPLADRLYIFATLVGFSIRGIIPLWLLVVLVGRDVALLVGIVPKLRRAGYGTTLPVHFLGKAATFNLLYAFPLLLIGQSTNHGLANIGNIFGWAFVGWGTALYLWAGVLYFVQMRDLTRVPLAR